MFLSVLGQIGQKDMGFREYLRVSAARISIVLLSVLVQIGQKDMGFSGYIRVSAARISDVSWEF